MVERSAFGLQHTNLCNIQPREVSSRALPSDGETGPVDNKLVHANVRLTRG